MRQVFKILIVSLFLLSLVACKCKDQKEIDKWPLTPHADTLCPMLGALPVFIKNSFPKPYAAKYQNVFEKSVVYFNKEVGTAIMAMASEEKRYLHHLAVQKKLVAKGHFRVWPFIVEFKQAPKSMQKFKGLCEFLKLDVGGTFGGVQATGFAETTFKVKELQGKRYINKIVVHVCIEKFEHAIKLMRTKIAQSVKIFGMAGIIRHEMGHIFIGDKGGADKKGHPAWYGDVMKGLNPGLNYHTLELIRQRIVAPCKKNGLISVPR